MGPNETRPTGAPSGLSRELDAALDGSTAARILAPNSAFRKWKLAVLS